jgi:hypothetical protein
MIWLLLTATAIFLIVVIWVIYYVRPKMQYRRYQKNENSYGHWNSYEHWDTSEPGFATLLTVATVGVLGVVTLILYVVSFSYQTHSTEVSSRVVSLTAIDTKEATEGRISGGIFVTYGYVESKPVLSYVSENEGAYRLQWADADKSTIYQDGNEDPRLITHTLDFYAKYVLPWPIATEDRYEFHVPEGTVSNEYTVSP